MYELDFESETGFRPCDEDEGDNLIPSQDSSAPINRFF